MLRKLLIEILFIIRKIAIFDTETQMGNIRKPNSPKKVSGFHKKKTRDDR